MDESEVCQHGTEPMIEQSPRYSSGSSVPNRFKPKLMGDSFVGNILEYILDHGDKTQYDAEDRCFRLNGELISAAQNIEEEEILDKLLWDYMMKKTKNNVSHIVETSGQVIVLTSTTTRPIYIDAG